ncbi:MAG TPA: DUF2231 domain-containing protein [Actinomycetota bacterium]|jgi:uncharacterized membrane protein|nr:DUF2231 domain-containing protein [Actinomycetota bacterium]
MRHFTVGPPLTLKGRKLKGLRGYSGKPLHPPLTDVPVTAYLFAAVFDVLSVALHSGHPAVATELFHAATWVLLGGAAVSLLTALTGWADWYYSSEAGTQARRTINTHAIIMIAVTVLVLVDLIVRLAGGGASTPAGLMVLTVVAAVLVTVGATYGGSMVYDYGFNIETSGDHPVWHKSEGDVWPGEKEPRGAASSGSGSVTAEPS